MKTAWPTELNWKRSETVRPRRIPVETATEQRELDPTHLNIEETRAGRNKR